MKAGKFLQILHQDPQTFPAKFAEKTKTQPNNYRIYSIVSRFWL